MARPFDAVLVIAFGGPLGPADVRPFLANVVRGRRVAAERVDAVAHHYELFGGVSPITALTRRQAAGLADRLKHAGCDLPVYVGMRNWHPLLADTLAEMARAGIRRAVGFIAAAHRSYSSCTQYRENVDAARAELRRAGLPDVEVTYVPDWHAHRDFVAACAENVSVALQRLPEDLRGRAQLVFTAHSIPVSMAERYPYRQQYEETATLVADSVGPTFRSGVQGSADSVGPTFRSGVHGSATSRFGHADAALKRRATGVREGAAAHACVYQSRSGRPEDPWLGPDVCDYLREARAGGLQAAVLSPIGFVCDHIEVLYDLDVEAAAVCRDIGLPMVRAAAANDHPRFLDMMAEVVLATVGRYDHARPLPLVAP